MSLLNLPWVIGPIPIVITVWAAYACGIAVAKQRPTSGEAFLAALMFPIGLIAIVYQLFLSDRNLNVALITSQLMGSIFFLIIMHASGWRRITESHDGKESPIVMRYFTMLVFVFVLYNTFILNFRGDDHCTIAKCFVLEWGLGRIDQPFSRLYLGGAFGALILIGVLPILFKGLLKFIRDGFRIK
ncbi:hypothetical protein BAE36_16765 [Rhizobium leguminosarum bv. trifolii]|jgi:hypothetical protein|uniref:Uncharacterized protein n=1 Tax=Rhizobium leguminosarum bv. trifolii TaxID=386 RepID=A0A1B8RBD9_RHILT|nr:hypothetical protein [Rhizobium leguminosarum]AOO91111.1 hypothetical protein [Rhizobium leguminosarum bv. trifolii]MBY5463010.1 hypothetical protein [Rhizobium leguminosarum]MBY5916466.1 hypothetical protein [Rhizobium leguminosarum]OBY06093.1 hypothetical protein BAE36_16765 [Rhizobium leguminosarum bv. trifolii]TBE90463.1 hypothetical protein ELG97_00470 [Rhizobium leguminosarum]